MLAHLGWRILKSMRMMQCEELQNWHQLLTQHRFRFCDEMRRRGIVPWESVEQEVQPMDSA
jgi:hypothetical protein